MRFIYDENFNTCTPEIAFMAKSCDLLSISKEKIMTHYMNPWMTVISVDMEPCVCIDIETNEFNFNVPLPDIMVKYLYEKTLRSYDEFSTRERTREQV